MVGLDYKYWTRIEVNGSSKHSSLLQPSNNHGLKSFYSVRPRLVEFLGKAFEGNSYAPK
jgi:hypothetical protein